MHKRRGAIAILFVLAAILLLIVAIFGVSLVYAQNSYPGRSSSESTHETQSNTYTITRVKLDSISGFAGRINYRGETEADWALFVSHHYDGNRWHSMPPDQSKEINLCKWEWMGTNWSAPLCCGSTVCCEWDGLVSGRWFYLAAYLDGELVADLMHYPYSGVLYRLKIYYSP